METRSNFNVYPHRVFASAILLDGMIVSWKVGHYRWTENNFISSNHPSIVFHHADHIKIRSVSFLCNNQREHNNAFHLAKRFFQQYKIHSEFNGFNPHK